MSGPPSGLGCSSAPCRSFHSTRGNRGTGAAGNRLSARRMVGRSCNTVVREMAAFMALRRWMRRGAGPDPWVPEESFLVDFRLLYKYRLNDTPRHRRNEWEFFIFENIFSAPQKWSGSGAARAGGGGGGGGPAARGLRCWGA